MRGEARRRVPELEGAASMRLRPREISLAMEGRREVHVGAVVFAEALEDAACTSPRAATISC